MTCCSFTTAASGRLLKVRNRNLLVWITTFTSQNFENTCHSFYRFKKPCIIQVGIMDLEFHVSISSERKKNKECLFYSPYSIQIFVKLYMPVVSQNDRNDLLFRSNA